MRKANPRLIKRLAAECRETLHREFPSYRWTVEPTADGSMLNIRAPLYTQEAYAVRTIDAQQTTSLRSLMREAGGHTLERFGMDRGRRSEANAQRNARGQYLAQA